MQRAIALEPPSAAVVLPESERVVRGLGVAKEALYVQLADAGYARLVRLPFNPAPRKPAPAKSHRGAKPPPPLSREMRLPFPAAMDELVTNPLATGALVRLASWTEARRYLALDVCSSVANRTPLLAPSRRVP